jgi:hypothetical protein
VYFSLFSPRSKPTLVWFSPSVTMMSFGEWNIETFRGKHATNPLPSAPIVNVFCTGNKHGLQDRAFPISSWFHEQEHYGFVLVQAPLANVTALRPIVCY